MILHGCCFCRLFWYDLLNEFGCLKSLLDLLVMGLDFADLSSVLTIIARPSLLRCLFA